MVLVALDDKLGPLTQVVGGVEIGQDTAHKKSRIPAAGVQQPGEQGGGGGLAVGAGGDDGGSVAEEMVGQGLGHGGDRQAPLPGGNRFRVVPAGNVSHHHQIRAPVQMVPGIALVDVDAEVLKLLTHRGIDVFIGAPDMPAGGLEQAGQGAHAGAADTHQMNTSIHGRKCSTRALTERCEDKYILFVIEKQSQ